MTILLCFFLPLFLFNSFWFYILYSIILEKVISNNFFNYSIILKCTYCFRRLERRFNGQFCDVSWSIFFEMKISCTIVSVWLVKSFLCLLCGICDWPIMLQAWPIRNQLFKISRTKTGHESNFVIDDIKNDSQYHLKNLYKFEVEI